MATPKTQTVELGDKVRDRVTGHGGIVTQRIENLDGCIQFTVRAPLKKDGACGEAYCIDVESLEIIKKGEVKVVQRPGGGPTTLPAKHIR